MTGNKVTPPAPRRRPRQSRSRELVRAIREAGLAILREQGAAALTTNAIAERAGVGIASLYRYYPDKQAILADIFDEQVQSIDRFYRQTLASQQLEGLSLREQIYNLVATPVELSRQLLQLHRDFFQHHHLQFEISYRPSPEGEQTWEEWAEDWWQRILRQTREPLRVTDTDLAATVMLLAVRGAIDSAIERHPALLEQAAFVDQLAAMASRYLLADRPG